MRLARTAPPLPRSLAGRSRTCDLRRPKPAGWPRSPTTRWSTSGGSRTRASGLRGRRHARSTTEASQSSGGRDRTCASRLTVARLAARPHRNGTEGEGVEPPRPSGPPAFEAGYRAYGSPSQRSRSPGSTRSARSAGRSSSMYRSSRAIQASHCARIDSPSRSSPRASRSSRGVSTQIE